jgi:hypothetical protein
VIPVVPVASGFAVFGPKTDRAAQIEKLLRVGSETRVLTTLLGPDSPLGWDLARQAADLERAGNNAALDE